VNESYMLRRQKLLDFRFWPWWRFKWQLSM